MTKTHVRYTAEIYLLTIDFSVSSFFSGWSQKLLVGPPNSSSVVTLKLEGFGSLRYQTIDHRQRRRRRGGISVTSCLWKLVDVS